MSPEQRQVVERLRRRLIERAWLAEDPAAYASGIDAAIGVVVSQFEEHAAAVTQRRAEAPQPR